MKSPQVYAVSDLGLVRPSNQDRHLADPVHGVYAVADGVGGNPSGEAAAEAALLAVANRARRSHEGMSMHAPTVEELTTLARRCAEDAAAAVRAIAKRGGRNEGAATTLTLVVHREGHAAMAHIGDSRLYLRRGGKLEQLSVDHTVANELMLAGAISPERARRHRLRHVLSRSLGGRRRCEVDTIVFPVAPGDTLMLTTDGLNEAVLDLGLSGESLETNARRLVNRANLLGGGDNATAVLVRVHDTTVDPRVRAVDLLTRTRPFSGLSLVSRSRVVGAGLIETLNAGDPLVRAGDTCSDFYLVLDGSCALTTDAVDTLMPGHWFGEHALIAPSTCVHDVVANERCVVFRLPASRWAPLARKRPRLGLAVRRRIESALTDDRPDEDGQSIPPGRRTTPAPGPTVQQHG